MDHSLKTRKVAEVTGFAVSLKINEESSLFVLLDRHGSINRSGSGTVDNTEGDLFIGLTDPTVFRSVLSQLDGEPLKHLGQRFEYRNPRGPLCKLALMFQFADGTSDGVEFLYGAESQGPPKFVVDFVTAAVRETDSWHQEFKQGVAKKP